MAKRGRKKGGKNEGGYPKCQIGIAFTKVKETNAQVFLKVINNRNIDEIMKLNYRLPGIPTDANIVAVVMGKTLVERLRVKHNIK